MNDRDLIARRALLKAAVTGAVALPLMGLASGAHADAALVPLTAADPIGKALGYVEDSTKVDPKSAPTHKPEQNCSNCVQYKGKPGDARGGCNIFAGKSVNSHGWCKTWAKKP